MNNRKGVQSPPPWTLDGFVFLVIITAIVGYIAVYSYINFYGLPLFCNSDTYADCQVAQRMWEQKTLFPEGWTFGNQYYVIATPVLAALMYGIVGDIGIAMSLATTFMTIFLFLSFIWLLKAVTDHPLTIAFSCLLLLSSITSPYGPNSINLLLFFTQASFYSCYLITLFIVLGDYIRVLYEKKSPLFPLALLLSFAAGMQSLRQTLIMVLPILALQCLKILICLVKKEPLGCTKVRKPLYHVMGYTISNIAGLIAIRLFHVANNTLYGSTTLASVTSLPQRFDQAVNAIVEITALRHAMLGETPRAFVLNILLMVLFALIALVICVKNLKNWDHGLTFCYLFLLVSIAAVLFATLILNVNLRSIYIFMWFPLVAVSGSMILEGKIPKFWKYAIVLVTCVISLTSLKDCFLPYLYQIHNTSASDIQQLANWATAQDYQYIYGDYWEDTPKIAIASHGALEAGCWHTPDNVFQVESCNTPQDIYGEAENARAIYVFTDVDESAGLEAARQAQISMTKVNEVGKYRVYTASGVLMHRPQS